MKSESFLTLQYKTAIQLKCSYTQKRRTVVKQSMWHQWLNLKFAKLRESLCAKKTKITIYLTILLPELTFSAVLESHFLECVMKLHGGARNTERGDEDLLFKYFIFNRTEIAGDRYTHTMTLRHGENWGLIKGDITRNTWNVIKTQTGTNKLMMTGKPNMGRETQGKWRIFVTLPPPPPSP